MGKTGRRIVADVQRVRPLCNKDRQGGPSAAHTFPIERRAGIQGGSTVNEELLFHARFTHPLRGRDG